MKAITLWQPCASLVADHFSDAGKMVGSAA